MAANAHYHSYMLRIWRDGADHPWRALLHYTSTGEKRTFADLHSLFLFLTEELRKDETSDEFTHLVTWLQSQTKSLLS